MNVKKSVYMTNATLNQLARNMITSYRSENVDNLYTKDLSAILSQRERNLLAVIMEMYDDFAELLGSYQRVERATDTKRYVFEGQSPTYHEDPNCDRMVSDFHNLEIPPEIKDGGDRSIERFREFCRRNLDLLKKDEEQFLNRLSAQFFLKNPPKTIVHDNSGRTNFMDLDLSELKELIDSLLSEAEEFRNKSEENIRIIRDKGFGTHKVADAKIEGHPLYIWHNRYKERLKDLLREYFRVRFNPDLKFDDTLLQQLGFSSCRSCSEVSATHPTDVSGVTNSRIPNEA